MMIVKTYMVVNFKTREISRDTHMLSWTSMLIKTFLVEFFSRYYVVACQFSYKRTLENISINLDELISNLKQSLINKNKNKKSTQDKKINTSSY